MHFGLCLYLYVYSNLIALNVCAVDGDCILVFPEQLLWGQLHYTKTNGCFFLLHNFMSILLNLCFAPITTAIICAALGCIVGKKWDPGILDPSPFSAKIRKVAARLGKFIQNIRKVGGET